MRIDLDTLKEIVHDVEQNVKPSENPVISIERGDGWYSYGILGGTGFAIDGRVRRGIPR